MSSKRKGKPPSKLIEEKRQCLTWNLQDAVQDNGNIVDGKVFLCDGGDALSTSASPLTEAACKKPESNDSKVLRNKAPKVAESSKIGEEVNDIASPWLTIPIQCSECARPMLPNEVLGPSLFQIMMTIDDLEVNFSCKGHERNHLDICENINGINFLGLKILEESFSNDDRYKAEIHLMNKRPDELETGSGKWKWNALDKTYFLPIFSGSLVLPKAVLFSIKRVVADKHLKLMVNLQNSNDNELFINAIIVESEQGVIASDNSYVNRRCHKVNMENIMSYFHGIFEENSNSDIKQKFCFTANEIPALYDHIKKYHGQRFSIGLADNEFAIAKDDTLSSISDEISNASSLDQGSSSNTLTESTKISCDEQIDEKEFDCHRDFLDEITQNSLDSNIEEGNIVDIKVNLLIPKLRRYQHAAVQWMVSKENETEYELGEEEHILWTKLTGVDNKRIYYNKFSGRVSSRLQNLPLPQGGILADEMGLGKTVEVLALILKNTRDEKFCLKDDCLPVSSDTDILGYTKEGDFSELVCCFCGNDAVYNVKFCCECSAPMHATCAGTQGREVQRYFCALCGTKKVIKTHSTLIISPDTIVYQWIEEIQKHVEKGALKFFFYMGVAKGGFIQPSILAEYDVIITTYETLKADFHHVKTEERRDRKLRNRKKYMALPSPLIYLEFWRVCLDEAQMIQCTTTKLAEMALRISAVHRWCVTGTPLQRGLEDIYGMLLFIGVFPYCIKTWWNRLLYQPLLQGDTKPLFDILARVMWRTEKNDVLDQINLPKQTETSKVLKFTPVEWQFYKRQEEVCTASALKEIDKWTEKETALSSLDKSSLHSLLAPLLRLRQACCHPRAVRDGVLGIHKSQLTMEKLLEGLKAKAKLECEEAHRQLMCALNGLAAIDIIEGNFAEAVTKYREAIQSSAAHKEMFRTDLLQKLHTVKNLSYALSVTTDCSHALSDDNLEAEAKELGKEYMKKSELQVRAAEEKLELIKRNLGLVKGSIDWKDPWWMGFMHEYKFSSVPEKEKELIAKMKNELSTQVHTSTFMGNKFTTIDGLQYLMVSKISTLSDLRDKLKESLVALKKDPTREVVLQTAECCLRNVGEDALRRNASLFYAFKEAFLYFIPYLCQRDPELYRLLVFSLCEFCQVDNLFTEYEGVLFSHRGMKNKGSLDAEDNKRFGGLRAETELDVVLKTLHSIVRQSVVKEEVANQAKAHINYMDLLKQEFKALRNLWFALHKRISALDELEMSSLRLRLRYENEDNKESYVIDFHEVPMQRFKLNTDKMVADGQLKKKKGQLFYLTNLEKAQNRLQDSNPETCPICEEKLGIEWAVFSCGHCFCNQCTTRLEQQYGVRSRRGGAKLYCPMCREPTFSEEISFVVMKDEKHNEDHEIEVKGNYSVKIEAIVRKILEIAKSDPDGKIILFSTWQDVLSIISDALIENDVRFKYGVGSRKKFQECLTAFKTLSCIKVLLLPLKRGSKGLNIIEATHVILVEPTLNPANELQAVGRVHRIGQTKPTFVHRFIVRDTVEERIQDLLKTKSTNDILGNNDAGSSLTIGDLTSLLV